MGRITALGIIIALIASATAAPAHHFLPLACLPISPPCQTCPPPGPPLPPCQNPCQQPSPCNEEHEPTPNGNEQIKVQIQKNTVPGSLRQIGFKEVSVPGGTFYIYSTPDVLIQPPPILVKPAKQNPITPPAITVQPPCLPPIKPSPIVVRPPRLPPITPPCVLARPKPLAPIQPPSIVVRPPKPAKIQPAPITVTQPKPDPIHPPQIVVRQPCHPALQPPTVCIQASALQNQGPRPCGNNNPIFPFVSPCPLVHVKQN